MLSTLSVRTKIGHWALLLVLIVLVGAAMACNLGSGGGSNPTPVPTAQPQPSLTARPTLTPRPTATLLPTSTPLPTLTPTPVCYPQTNWPQYIVVSGDTLGRIADRLRSVGVNTSAALLAQANCLDNPNTIRVGQVLYVPGNVPPPTPIVTPTFTFTPDNSRPVFRRALTVERHWIEAGRAITYADTVRVDAGVVDNAWRVEFFVTRPGSGTSEPIGTDPDPWDGAFVNFSFGVPGVYSFRAIAASETRTADSTLFTIEYDPNFVPPEGQYNLLSVTPNLGSDGGWLKLTNGSTVYITWPHAPVGAVRVEFTLTPTGTGTADGATVIATDLNPADGAEASWAVNNAYGHLEAVATMPDGKEVRSRITNVLTE